MGDGELKMTANKIEWKLPLLVGLFQPPLEVNDDDDNVLTVRIQQNDDFSLQLFSTDKLNCRAFKNSTTESTRQIV